MKKLKIGFCFLLMIVITLSCEEDIILPLDSELNNEKIEAIKIIDAKGVTKIDILHFAKSDGIWEVISVTEKLLENRIKHGDVLEPKYCGTASEGGESYTIGVSFDRGHERADVEYYGLFDGQNFYCDGEWTLDSKDGNVFTYIEETNCGDALCTVTIIFNPDGSLTYNDACDGNVDTYGTLTQGDCDVD